MLAHYSRPEVKREIAEYCRGRWVAVEGEEQGGRVFMRYWRHGGSPITVAEPSDVDEVFRRLRGVRPRTIYASINVYRELRVAEDADKPENIARSTPTWDVDADLDSWRYALRAAEVIVSRLDREGVSRSVFLKWSGRGVHVHIHEGAFSPELLSKHNPLDVSFAVVEYVLRKCRDDLVKLAVRAPLTGRPLRVEDKVDLKRVFTAPLSLHRQLDLCCVCFKPNDLASFSIDWARPSSYRHDPSWREHIVGEGDELALKALSEVGGYDGWPGRPKQERTIVEPPALEVEEAPPGKIGRFQAMGLLQAARYYLLTGDLERAKSFGLNRAVFYAWAKRYARDRIVSAKRPPPPRDGRRVEMLGDEGAYVSPRGWFALGDVEQTPSDYDKQIAKKIDAVIPYEEAWRAALEYLKSFPRSVLLDQQRFFNEVYKPVRDDLLSIVRRMKGKGRQLTLDQLFKEGG